MVQDKGKLVHAHPANELTEKLFGFESVVNKVKQAAVNATSFTLYSDSVPAGKIWKITYVSARNLSGDIATRYNFSIVHDDTSIVVKYKVGSIPRHETVEVAGEFYLNAGDCISVYLVGVGIGETCEINIFGYEMNAP